MQRAGVTVAYRLLPRTGLVDRFELQGDCKGFFVQQAWLSFQQTQNDFGAHPKKLSAQ